MKFISIFFLSVLLNANVWENDFNLASQKAKTNHQYMVINFSGSDWCGPCIRMRKEIFESEAFINYSSKNLILLRADFPRLKKNQLTAEQLKKNNDLAVRYNPDGDFPLTILVNENGKLIKEWKGYQNVTPQNFIQQIQNATK